ncbi:hypothetical protein EVAR_93580_1 [Eumeta japonica]|uniref:Uncharacterized protein n=1 Tax=Eumeta variegata TaxID=151549 RepID=A0A4C1UR58_EUMVA|nr:hypothetical protein EVAR_93580_1 [Eumeta japonica]
MSGADRTYVAPFSGGETRNLTWHYESQHRRLFPLGHVLAAIRTRRARVAAQRDRLHASPYRSRRAPTDT